MISRGFREVFARFSRGFRQVFARLSRGFREVFARFSQGFRKVFARLSLQKYFRERSAPAEKNKFLRAAGAPVRRRRGRGPPRHAKIDFFLLARTFHENIFEAKASRKPHENLAKISRKCLGTNGECMFFVKKAVQHRLRGKKKQHVKM